MRHVTWIPALLALALAACSQGQAGATPSPTPASGDRVEVTVDGGGYHPSSVSAPAGKALTLVFKRTTDQSCGTEVVFPSLNIRRDLPLNQPVEITVTPAGTIAFTCGMGMYRGSIVAQ